MGSVRLNSAQESPRMNSFNYTLISDRTHPGLTMTAPTVRHRDVGDEYATDVRTIKNTGRENISVGTFDVRSLRPTEKLEGLAHVEGRYYWGSVGCAEKKLW